MHDRRLSLCGGLKSLVLTMGMIRIEHTLFAMPFCLAALLVASNGRPGWPLLLWVLVALTSARAAAMTFNRIVDLPYDAGNVRTRQRHLVVGSLSRRFATGFLLVSVAVFVLAAWRINDLALRLSPVALLVVLGYSYTKRFTQLSHFILGLGLSLAPLGAWVAVLGRLEAAPLPLAAGVILWVGGFDIIYACQDADFDRQYGLHSIPARLGVERALALSRLAHFGSVLCLAGFGVTTGLHAAYFAGVTVAGILVVYEHSLVRPDDLTRVNAAFFTMNSIISLLILAATAVDVYAFPRVAAAL